MDVGWNFRREHLRPQQRSHYVITDGGDQPNVVPSEASVWYYFREVDYPHIAEMFEIGNTMAQGAAMMTGTTMSSRILGQAWPGHFKQKCCRTDVCEYSVVGLPAWSEADQILAKGIQREVKSPPAGLASKSESSSRQLANRKAEHRMISVTFPGTCRLSRSVILQIFGAARHHWANAVSMATPIAHKGVTAGAKVQAMTILDLLLRPEKVTEAWEYFRNVQTKDQKYIPFMARTTSRRHI